MGILANIMVERIPKRSEIKPKKDHNPTIDIRKRYQKKYDSLENISTLKKDHEKNTALKKDHKKDLKVSRMIANQKFNTQNNHKVKNK